MLFKLWIILIPSLTFESLYSFISAKKNTDIHQRKGWNIDLPAYRCSNDTVCQKIYDESYCITDQREIHRISKFRLIGGRKSLCYWKSREMNNCASNEDCPPGLGLSCFAKYNVCVTDTASKVLCVQHYTTLSGNSDLSPCGVTFGDCVKKNDELPYCRNKLDLLRKCNDSDDCSFGEVCTYFDEIQSGWRCYPQGEKYERSEVKIFCNETRECGSDLLCGGLKRNPQCIRYARENQPCSETKEDWRPCKEGLECKEKSHELDGYRCTKSENVDEYLIRKFAEQGDGFKFWNLLNKAVKMYACGCATTFGCILNYDDDYCFTNEINIKWREKIFDSNSPFL